MDDTVDLLEELPANLVTRILEQVDKDRRAQINTILNYPEDSAGSIMKTEYVGSAPDDDGQRGHGPYQKVPGFTRKRFIPVMCWKTEGLSGLFQPRI